MFLKCGVGEDSFRVPWTARRSNQPILKEIISELSLEGLMLKLKLQFFGHLMWRTDLLEKTLMLGKIEGRKRRGWQRMRWLDGSPTLWTWVCISSRIWRWTEKPGVLQSMGLQRVGHDWETEMNWWSPLYIQGSLIPGSPRDTNIQGFSSFLYKMMQYSRPSKSANSISKDSTKGLTLLSIYVFFFFFFLSMIHTEALSFNAILPFRGSGYGVTMWSKMVSNHVAWAFAFLVFAQLRSWELKKGRMVIKYSQAWRGVVKFGLILAAQSLQCPCGT